jgi:dopamine receptor D2
MSSLKSSDRFIAVTRPLQYAKHRFSKRVHVTLALTWIVSAAVSSPIVLGWNYTDRRRQTPLLCTFYNADFLIYSSMASFYIPCIAMILLYCKTLRVILAGPPRVAGSATGITASPSQTPRSPRNRQRQTAT